MRSVVPTTAVLMFATGLTTGLGASVIAPVLLTSAAFAKEGKPAANKRSAVTAATTQTPISPRDREATAAAIQAISSAANQAYDRGNFLSAYRSWRGLARQGNGLAAFRIGHLYRSGKGVSANPRRALQWFRQAAQSRIAAAHYQIGIMHLAGEHVGRDIAEAWARFHVAARLGDQRARAALGYISTRMDTLEMWRARHRAKDLWPKPVEAAR